MITTFVCEGCYRPSGRVSWLVSKRAMELVSGTLIGDFRSNLAGTAAIEMRAPPKSYKCFHAPPAICSRTQQTASPKIQTLPINWTTLTLSFSGKFGMGFFVCNWLNGIIQLSLRCSCTHNNHILPGYVTNRRNASGQLIYIYVSVWASPLWGASQEWAFCWIKRKIPKKIIWNSKFAILNSEFE